MVHTITPAQKAAAKAFVKALKDLKKNTKLENKRLAELLGVKAPRLWDWLSGRRMPDAQAQAEVREAASESRDTLENQVRELFSFIAVITPDCSEETAKD